MGVDRIEIPANVRATLFNMVQNINQAAVELEKSTQYVKLANARVAFWEYIKAAKIALGVPNGDPYWDIAEDGSAFIRVDSPPPGLPIEVEPQGG